MKGCFLRTQAWGHEMMPLARLAQGRNSATASSQEPFSQQSPSVSQVSFQSSINAWADWKLKRIQQSWEQFRGQFQTSTQQERLLEVCRCTRHQPIGWQFSAGLGGFRQCNTRNLCQVRVGRQHEGHIAQGKSVVRTHEGRIVEMMDIPVALEAVVNKRQGDKLVYGVAWSTCELMGTSAHHLWMSWAGRQSERWRQWRIWSSVAHVSGRTRVPSKVLGSSPMAICHL